MNMFLQQGQGSHTAMPGDFIIRNDRDVYQRESAAVECSGQNRVVKLIQPAGGVRIRAAFTGIEKDRYHQWQLLMASFQVSLHGGHRIAYQAKSHMFVG